MKKLGSGHPGSDNDEVCQVIDCLAPYAVSDRAAVLQRGDPFGRSPVAEALAPQRDGDEDHRK